MGKTEGREKTYLTPNQVAEKLMVSPITVRGWALRGLLKAEVTPGGHRRFLVAEVERFARERSTHDRQRPQRILIVDDNQSLARYLQDFLGTQGYTTETAFDGFDAGWKMQSFQPDILLLDLMMPRLNGFDVCRQVRGNGDTRHVRVLAMTGYPSPSNEQRILAEGAECCLSKPIDENSLLAALGHVAHSNAPPV
ncbi:MAG: response regulator [Pseudomonadota bacterium]|nr:response regulator [Pseudomonadota bacterium]